MYASSTTTSSPVASSRASSSGDVRLPRRVVRRREEDQLRGRRGLLDRLDVQREALEARHVDHAAAGDLRRERVHAEGRRAVDHAISRQHDRTENQVDQVVAAEAAHDALDVGIEVACQRLADFALVRVGIDVIRPLAGDGGERLRRGAEGVLVAVELDHVGRRDAEALGQHVRRHDRHVARQLEEVGPDQRAHIEAVLLHRRVTSPRRRARRPAAAARCCGRAR